MIVHLYPHRCKKPFEEYLGIQTDLYLLHAKFLKCGGGSATVKE